MYVYKYKCIHWYFIILANQKMEELTENKKHLVALQEELVKQEIIQSAELHALKMKYLSLEHEMKISNLKLKNDFYKKKLELI